MFGSTEFTHPALPGLTGITWGGKAHTVFATEDAANAAFAAEARNHQDLELRVVPRSDGKWLLAAIDREDATFIYVQA